MSSGTTTTIVVLSTTPGGRSSGAGGSDGDDVRCRTCYGVVVGCVSLFLFCVLAATAGVVKACVVTGLTVAFFGLVGWLVPRTSTSRTSSATAMATGRRGAMGARRVTLHNVDASRVVMAALRRVGYSCSYVGAAAVNIPPAFAYESCLADAESSGKSEGSAMCAVCLEDVQQGEMVRRLPACGHLFHKDCIDMWLHSHTTCPLCRSELAPRRDTMRTIEVVAAPSAADVLPPV